MHIHKMPKKRKTTEKLLTWGRGEVVGYLIYLSLLGQFLMHANVFSGNP